MVDTMTISDSEPAPSEAPDQPLLGEDKKETPKEDDQNKDGLPSDQKDEDKKPAEEGKAERPDWLPEKFDNVEDFVKAHTEAEQKITELSTKLKTSEGMTDDEIDETLQSSGLNLQSFKDELESSGQLSEDSYKKLADAGFDKTVVDSYIEGQQAIANNMASEVKAIAGGDDNYAKMINWASQNLSEEEIAAYDKAVGTDTATAKMAAQALHARYTQAVGKTPNLKTGDKANTSGDVYRDWSEVTKDMKDGRYKTSEAFRKDVEAKLARSKLR